MGGRVGNQIFAGRRETTCHGLVYERSTEANADGGHSVTEDDVEEEIEELLGEVAEYDNLEEMLDELDDEFDEEDSLDIAFDESEE